VSPERTVRSRGPGPTWGWLWVSEHLLQRRCGRFDSGLLHQQVTNSALRRMCRIGHTWTVNGTGAPGPPRKRIGPSRVWGSRPRLSANRGSTGCAERRWGKVESGHVSTPVSWSVNRPACRVRLESATHPQGCGDGVLRAPPIGTIAHLRCAIVPTKRVLPVAAPASKPATRRGAEAQVSHRWGRLIVYRLDGKGRRGRRVEPAHFEVGEPVSRAGAVC